MLWHDAQVAGALEAGIDQVAVIGAGYDSRAWRFGGEGIQFFELDSAATQRDKVRRAPGDGPTYVEADLRIDSAAMALGDGGLDWARPVVFVLEGLTMYLDAEVVGHQLTELSQMSAAGSRLTTDFYPPRDLGATRDRRQHRMQHLARAGSGEGLNLLVDRGEASELLEASGWDVVEVKSMREAGHIAVPPGSGLPVEAINDNKTVMSAARG